MKRLSLPQAGSEALQSFVEAIRARSRALKTKWRALECEHNPANETNEYESVRLHAHGDARNSVHQSLRLSADRWCRFDAWQGSKDGWVFVWFFEGRVAPARTGTDLITAFEEAKTHVWRPPINHVALDALWSPILLRGPRS